MDLSKVFTVNGLLDVILIAAAIWMVITVRGLGGIIGAGLNLITIGAVILGFAHLISTVIKSIWGPDVLPATTEALIHRLIVLVGFIVLVWGFRRIEAIKK